MHWGERHPRNTRIHVGTWFDSRDSPVEDGEWRPSGGATPDDGGVTMENLFWHSREHIRKRPPPQGAGGCEEEEGWRGMEEGWRW